MGQQIDLLWFHTNVFDCVVVWKVAVILFQVFANVFFKLFIPVVGWGQIKPCYLNFSAALNVKFLIFNCC